MVLKRISYILERTVADHGGGLSCPVPTRWTQAEVASLQVAVAQDERTEIWRSSQHASLLDTVSPRKHENGSGRRERVGTCSGAPHACVF